MLRFESDIAVIELDPFDNVKELQEIAYRLFRTTATGELKGVVLDLQGQEKLDRLLLQPLVYLHLLRERSRSYHKQGSSKSRFIVFCNPLSDRFESPKVNLKFSFAIRPFHVAKTVDDAISSILESHDIFPRRSDVPAEPQPGGPHLLFAVGCTEQDLGDIPEQLRDAGFEVADSSTDSVKDGDHVVFCISCANGPNDGTKRSVRSCAGREIFPVRIVWNFTEVVVDESLLELVSFEMNDLLSEILPQEVIDSMPVFHDFDLNLPAKIIDRLNQKPLSFHCK